MESSKNKKTKQKENENKKIEVRRIVLILMVILNASCNLVLKSPTIIRPIYELAKYLYQDGNFNDYFYYGSSAKLITFNHIYCIDLNFCMFFEDFVKFLYLLSLCLNIFFFYKFDKNFKACFAGFFESRIRVLFFLLFFASNGCEREGNITAIALLSIFVRMLLFEQKTRRQK